MVTQKSDSKKLLFCGFDSSPTAEALASFLMTHPDVKVGVFASVNHITDSASVFLSRKEALSMVEYHRHPTNEIPSRQLIEALQGDASVILKMMEKISPGTLKSQEHEYRKHCYYALLSFFLGFLKTEKFDHLIFSKTPGDPCCLILFHLATQLGLKTTFLQELPVPETFIAAETLSSCFEQLDAPSIADDSRKLPTHLQEEKALRLAGTIPAKSKSVFRQGFRQFLFCRFPNWLVQARLKKVKSLDSLSYLYFPLEDTAETPTPVSSGVFIDLYYAIVMTARALPKGTTLLVQENLNPHDLHRAPGFYQLLADEPNIAFASPKMNRLELIRKSLAVATVAGDLGWTALFQEKRVILFGTAFYQDLPGVHRAKSITSIQSALQQESPTATEADLTRFLHHLAHHSHHGASEIATALEQILSPAKETE